MLERSRADLARPDRTRRLDAALALAEDLVARGMWAALEAQGDRIRIARSDRRDRDHYGVAEIRSVLARKMSGTTSP